MSLKNAPRRKISNNKPRVEEFWSERFTLLAALFIFLFGMGLITDGKKMLSQQLKLSQRVDYRATLNSNSNN